MRKILTAVIFVAILAGCGAPAVKKAVFDISKLNASAGADIKSRIIILGKPAEPPYVFEIKPNPVTEGSFVALVNGKQVFHEDNNNGASRENCEKYLDWVASEIAGGKMIWLQDDVVNAVPYIEMYAKIQGILASKQKTAEKKKALTEATDNKLVDTSLLVEKLLEANKK
jgi:hypothetical protein